MHELGHVCATLLISRIFRANERYKKKKKIIILRGKKQKYKLKLNLKAEYCLWGLIFRFTVSSVSPRDDPLENFDLFL